MTDETDKKERSKYNEAILQLQRLHNLWLKIGKVTEHGRANLEAWKFYLDDVWRELVADVERQPNKEEITTRNQELKEKIAKSKTINEKYNNLNERHEFLKILQDKVGKGGAYLDESEEDIE